MRATAAIRKDSNKDPHPTSSEPPREAERDARRDEGEAHEEAEQIRRRRPLELGERLFMVAGNQGRYGPQTEHFVALGPGPAERVHAHEDAIATPRKHQANRPASVGISPAVHEAAEKALTCP